ncbi:hypothetical protein V8E36_007082 [Tilletia maclaganii]
MWPIRGRRSGDLGPYPAAVCHFCRSESRIVPPIAASSPQQQPLRSIHDAPISHGNLESWLCSACQCYNRTDRHEHGGMSSWEPAMSEPRMNEDSFALRATAPPSARLLRDAHQERQARDNPFCHTCTTNQTLLMNMLSSYLPDEQDPTYSDALANLPAYKASLLTRYPLVCDECNQAVQAQLARANDLSKQEALRHFLARGRELHERRTGMYTSGKDKGKGKKRQRDDDGSSTASVWTETLWYGRGAAWCITNAVALLIPAILMFADDDAAEVLDGSTQQLVIAAMLGSILWTAWNPKWRRVRELRRRGSDVRIVGQQKWAQAQVVLWLLRLLFIAACSAGRHDSDLWAGLSKPGLDLPLICGLSMVLQICCHWYGWRALQLRSGKAINLHASATLHNTFGPIRPARDGAGEEQEDAFSTALSLQSTSLPSAIATRRPVSGSTSGSPHAAMSSGLDHLFQRNPGPQMDDGEDKSESSHLGAARTADAMDWMPTAEASSALLSNSGASSGGFAPWAESAAPSTTPQPATLAYQGTSPSVQAEPTLGPQRFFAPEQPTGLEDLLLDALQFRDDGERAQLQKARSARSGGGGWGSWWRR